MSRIEEAYREWTNEIGPAKTSDAFRAGWLAARRRDEEICREKQGVYRAHDSSCQWAAGDIQEAIAREWEEDLRQGRG